VGSKLISFKILNGNVVDAIAGSVPAPNSGSFENTGSQAPNGAHQK